MPMAREQYAPSLPADGRDDHCLSLPDGRDVEARLAGVGVAAQPSDH
jgi:hypothetical protein